jgi:hypothetical protein
MSYRSSYETERALDWHDRLAPREGQTVIDQVMTLNEACQFLSVSKSWLRTRLWRGYVTYRLVGRHYIISKESLLRLAQKEGINVA